MIDELYYSTYLWILHQVTAFLPKHFMFKFSSLWCADVWLQTRGVHYNFGFENTALTLALVFSSAEAGPQGSEQILRWMDKKDHQ